MCLSVYLINIPDPVQYHIYAMGFPFDLRCESVTYIYIYICICICICIYIYMYMHIILYIYAKHKHLGCKKGKAN